MADCYIGLMSGTSLDGADGVLVSFEDDRLTVLAAASRPFASALRSELLSLNTSGPDELHRAAQAAHQMVCVYAEVVDELVRHAGSQGISQRDIAAVGVHGQTVRHQPQGRSAAGLDKGYTLQLNNPALLAELTGIDVVADFRSRDVAAGGQGAPLAPAFHQSVFGRSGETVCVLNVGGISNLSVLEPNSAAVNSAPPILGFDCGPGNALMDAWCQRYTGQAYDLGGAWAATGELIPELLCKLLDEPYLALPPPKSTGRDLFSLRWLDAKLAPFADKRPQDIQNTLTEFTASACISSVNSYGKDSTILIVCGGGAFNNHLMERLQAGLPGIRVDSSTEYGLPPLQVEAAAFAWLARQTMHRRPGNLASVTGAAGPRVLGAIYPR